MMFAACAAGRANLLRRAEQLLGVCDERKLCSLLVRLRLLEYVGGRMVATAGEGRFPQLALRARGATVAARAHGEVQAVVQYAALERLTKAGIRAAPLKGPDLALRVYGDLGLRRCADLDIVVDPERLDDAVGVLQTLGYDSGPPAGSPWLTELHRRLTHRLAVMPMVEIHWRTECYSSEASTGGLARAALERAVPDVRGRGLQFRLADELALLLLVYARDGMPGLRLPVDIAAWWDRYGSQLPTLPLQEIIDADPRLAVPLATAAALCERLVGIPAASLLEISPARSCRGQLAARLSSAFLDEPPKHSAATLVDGLLGGRATVLSFARRRLLLRRGHIATMYRRDDAPTWRAPTRLLQVQHPLRQLIYFAWYMGSPAPRPPKIEWSLG
jgi:hypothetical protein